MNMTKLLDGLKSKKKIIMLTAYDFQMARILQSLSVDLLLVGDSLGVVFQGHTSTKHVTMDDICYHTTAVSRGAGIVPVIADMPIGSFGDPKTAVSNAKLCIDAGASGVKFEGYFPEIAAALTAENIPVMGHLGLLPQTAEKYHVVGKAAEEADAMISHALGLCDAGVFAIVFECIPENLAKTITAAIPVPSIGIGAGKYCDGQVLVINDLLGLDRGESHPPKFRKQYADIGNTIANAVNMFITEVDEERYPDDGHTYH